MDAEARAAAWTFIVVLGGLKLGAACLIFSLQPSAQSAGLLVALHGSWLVAPCFLLAALPLAYWLRLLRARARRRRLIRSEWQVEDRSTEWKARITRGTM